MAPQVASLSELSRIRGDAEVRYPYAETEPKLFPPPPLGLNINGETRAKKERGGGQVVENNEKKFFWGGK